MKSSSERSTADIYAELLQSLRDKSCKIEEVKLNEFVLSLILPATTSHRLPSGAHLMP